MMKEGVEKAGLKAHYMVQSLAYHTPDCSCQGFIDPPEFPFVCAHTLCWCTTLHCSKLKAASEKHGNWGAGLEMHTKPWVRARARRDYWETLKPASGRPLCPSLSVPDSWGVTKGHTDLLQQKTTQAAVR
ncbi:Betaine--homocysteine S-methyltransferase 1 [Collichthys lucidus]|uniref:Betaine--homocysteine S-methyltransferase 1 n=1 Tax=Collichthys lucidus TaxID=240159 RepID=A0A4U5UTL9_COLLU|nr:Betaine--homocysteine S-methyltransferase 1 [Collichthys lucidus]